MATTIFISIALLVVCWGIPTPNDVNNFLHGQVLCSAMNFSQKNYIYLFQGLASHIDRFVEEEVEVRHIPHLSNDLRSLGFVTIGSRQRIRSAATAWVPQVICLCSFYRNVMCWKKFSTNTTMCSSSREKYDTRKVLFMFLHIGRQTRPAREREFLWIALIFRKKCASSAMNQLKNLYHTTWTCRNQIPAEKTTRKRVKLQMWTRKMERERKCELIWCSNVTWQYAFSSGRWFKIIFHTKCTRGRIDLFVCFFS